MYEVMHIHAIIQVVGCFLMFYVESLSGNQSKVVIQKVKPEPGGTQSSQPETSRWSACSAYM